MARTLEAAVQDRMTTQKKLSSVENEAQSKSREIQDLKNQLQKAQSEKVQAQKDIQDVRNQLTRVNA